MISEGTKKNVCKNVSRLGSLFSIGPWLFIERAWRKTRATSMLHARTIRQASELSWLQYTGVRKPMVVVKQGLANVGSTWRQCIPLSSLTCYIILVRQIWYTYCAASRAFQHPVAHDRFFFAGTVNNDRNIFIPRREKMMMTVTMMMLLEGWSRSF